MMQRKNFALIVNASSQQVQAFLLDGAGHKSTALPATPDQEAQ